jgi:hypothetical protein
MKTVVFISGGVETAYGSAITPASVFEVDKSFACLPQEMDSDDNDDDDDDDVDDESRKVERGRAARRKVTMNEERKDEIVEKIHTYF